MNRTIEVKTLSSVFPDVWNGRKLSELRLDDDKDYSIGCELLQKEWRPLKRKFSGRWVSGRISAITRLSHWMKGVDHRWVILHLDPESILRGKTQ